MTIIQLHSYSQVNSSSYLNSIKDTVISCNGLPVYLNENPDTNFIYQWSPSNGLSDSTSANPIVHVSITTLYKVHIFDKSGNNIENKLVTLFVPPEIKLKCNNDTVLCYTRNLLLQAYTDPVVSIEWKDEFGNLIGKGYRIERYFQDSVNVFVFATDQFGCKETDTINIVPININYKIVQSSPLCAGNDGVVKFVSLDGHNYKFNWTTASGLIISDPTDNVIRIRSADTSIFNLIFENEYGCSYKDSFQIDISRFDPPLKAFADNDTILLGHSTILHVTKGYANYKWLINNYLSCFDCSDPVVRPTNSTLFTVQAQNEDGCIEQTDVPVIVIRPNCNESDIFIPNAFSPNNDGNNDILKISSNFMESVEFSIYNRWGQKVFETNDKFKWWDGTSKGILMPSDIYSYYCKIGCIDGSIFIKKGNVLLLR